jgi:hypothetical protein
LFAAVAMDRAKRELQHLGLPTAAALVHFGVAGTPPDASDPAQMRGVLNDIGRALSNVMSIYAADPESGDPKEIPAFELLEATFQHGAHVLVTARGKEYRGLTVRRGDLKEAVTLLKRVRFSIRKGPSGSRR